MTTAGRTDATNERRRSSLTTFDTGLGLKKCSRNWFYVPFINVFIEYIGVNDPPTPEELSTSLEVTGLISALFIAMIAAGLQSFSFGDHEEAFFREAVINSTNGHSLAGGADPYRDPYSKFLASTSTSLCALFAVLLITCLMIFHQSSVDFSDPHTGEYSKELRQAWWTYARFPMALNLMLMGWGLFFATVQFQMLAYMMLPNPGGSKMVNGIDTWAIQVMFEPGFKTTHKYNFSALFMFDIGWYFEFIGGVVTLGFFSCALAKKHWKRGKMKTLPRNPTKIVAETNPSGGGGGGGGGGDELSVKDTLKELASMQLRIIELVQNLAKKSAASDGNYDL
jgi:hypothetical protein